MFNFRFFTKIVKKASEMPENSKSPNLLRNYKIKVRLVSAFLIISSLPLIITAIISFQLSSNAIKEKISTYSMELTNQVGLNASIALKRIESDSVDIAFTETTQNTLSKSKDLTEGDILAAQRSLNDMLTRRFAMLNDVTDVQLFTKENMAIIAFGDINNKMKLKKDFQDDFIKKSSTSNGVPVWSVISRENEDRNELTSLAVDKRLDGDGIVLTRLVKSLEEQSLEVLETDKAFRTILKSMGGITQYFSNMENSVTSALKTKDRMLYSIQNISAVSEETAATVEEISASTQEQMAQAQEVSELARNLDVMSRELGEMIKKFKFEDE